MQNDNQINDSPVIYAQKSQDWNNSVSDNIRRSERTAWYVATVCICVAVVSVVGIVVALPLKSVEPYVVRVDSVTGVPDIVTAMVDYEVTGEDVMNKYWLANYVRHREGYNIHTVAQDYNAVGYFSDDQQGKTYAAQFQGDDAKHEVLGDTVTVEITILSVVPSDSVGTVRFRAETINKRTNQVENDEKFVATISYVYRSAERTNESTRLVNPFGFQVTSYRVDSEMVGGAS